MNYDNGFMYIENNTARVVLSRCTDTVIAYQTCVDKFTKLKKAVMKPDVYKNKQYLELNRGLYIAMEYRNEFGEVITIRNVYVKDIVEAVANYRAANGLIEYFKLNRKNDLMLKN